MYIIYLYIYIYIFLKFPSALRGFGFSDALSGLSWGGGGGRWAGAGGARARDRAPVHGYARVAPSIYEYIQS